MQNHDVGNHKNKLIQLSKLQIFTKHLQYKSSKKLNGSQSYQRFFWIAKEYESNRSTTLHKLRS